MTAPDVVVEPFDPDNPEHVGLTETGEVCATQNENNESTADLSEVVPDGSQG